MKCGTNLFFVNFFSSIEMIQGTPLEQCFRFKRSFLCCCNARAEKLLNLFFFFLSLRQKLSTSYCLQKTFQFFRKNSARISRKAKFERGVTQSFHKWRGRTVVWHCNKGNFVSISNITVHVVISNSRSKGRRITK